MANPQLSPNAPLTGIDLVRKIKDSNAAKAAKKLATKKSPPLTNAKVNSYYNNKVNSCKSRKIAFHLTKAQVRELMEIEFCAYTGIRLTRTGSDNKQLPTDFTLERVDCDVGYTLENTIAVCYAANSVKSVLESQFRNKANDVIHGISNKLREMEAKQAPSAIVQHTLVQKIVLWAAERVGLSV